MAILIANLLSQPPAFVHLSPMKEPTGEEKGGNVRKV
jgi:hypothetical protein